MRVLAFALLTLLAVPMVCALAPLDVYAGADPIARLETYPDPYTPAGRMACIAPMTLQVQRNAAGSWDLLARGVAVSPSPLDVASEPGIAESSLTNCATYVAPTLSVTNLVGNPSTGLSKILAATTCYRESVQLSPFTTGGPAFMHYSFSYARSCYGSGYTFSMSVAPTAMG